MPKLFKELASPWWWPISCSKHDVKNSSKALKLVKKIWEKVMRVVLARRLVSFFVGMAKISKEA